MRNSGKDGGEDNLACLKIESRNPLGGTGPLRVCWLKLLCLWNAFKDTRGARRGKIGFVTFISNQIRSSTVIEILGTNAPDRRALLDHHANKIVNKT